MSCIRSCYDKGGTNFGHDDCKTCIHADRRPPKREWVGLTDKDLEGVNASHRVIAKWAEAKLKEKNG
jgi:hypothetical protein